MLDWKTNSALAAGKGATVQQFVAILGKDRLEAEVAPWGEGHLRINGRDIAHIDDAKDRRQAFREIKKIAERYAETHMSKNGSLTLPAVKAKLLEGKRGLIVGIANENSIAWGCAKAFRAFGAEVAVTYLNDKAKKYVEPLARALEAPIMMPLDVTVRRADGGRLRTDRARNGASSISSSTPSPFRRRKRCRDAWSTYRAKAFAKTMDVSCWTFIRMAHLAEPLMKKGGTLFTMSYYGSQMVVKNYNIMGVAKAALECAVRYIAAELGPKGIRVHAISPGPLATRAASGIPEFDALLDKAKAKAPARSLVSIDDVGVATAFLAHDAARLITGETLYIDGGYHIMD